MSESPRPTTPIRREPPPFLHVVVEATEALGPRLMRVRLVGEELGKMETPQPAASVRLLLPHPGAELEIPVWQGNEFLNADGTRPIIRTFTPRRFDPTSGQLEIDMVLHSAGAASAWIQGATTGDVAAVSGPARGYDIDPEAPSFLLAGDESAVPAMAQLLEVLPGDTPVRVHIAAEAAFGTVPLPDHPRATVAWHEVDDDRGGARAAALRNDETVTTAAIWCAGQAAAMQHVRKLLFQELGLPRSQGVVRGYWK